MSAGNPTKKMKMWGVGRIFARISLAYGLLIWATEHFFSLNFKIAIIPPYLRAAPGVLLIVTGLIFFAAAVTAVRRALSAGRLVTTGVFRCCRHPLYAAWPVFIVPGIALLAGSWLGLTVPVFMFAVLSLLVRKEEKTLEEEFGPEYREYRKKVPAILPYGCLKRND